MGVPVKKTPCIIRSSDDEFVLPSCSSFTSIQQQMSMFEAGVGLCYRDMQISQIQIQIQVNMFEAGGGTSWLIVQRCGMGAWQARGRPRYPDRQISAWPWTPACLQERQHTLLATPCLLHLNTCLLTIGTAHFAYYTLLTIPGHLIAYYRDSTLC